MREGKGEERKSRDKGGEREGGERDGVIKLRISIVLDRHPYQPHPLLSLKAPD